jgi:hypothetical protein
VSLRKKRIKVTIEIETIEYQHVEGDAAADVRHAMSFAAKYLGWYLESDETVGMTTPLRDTALNCIGQLRCERRK